MRIENSPKFEREMEAHRKKRDREQRAAKESMGKTVFAGKGRTWTPMEECPFSAFCLWTGTNDALLVTDGKTVTVARITKRFGTPIFWKKEPETVIHDGMMCLVGGELDPRPDLPKWWWKWEIRDELERETPEVNFVATHWMFLPPPPSKKLAQNQHRDATP